MQGSDGASRRVSKPWVRQSVGRCAIFDDRADRASRSTQMLWLGSTRQMRHGRDVSKTQRISAGIRWGTEAGVRSMCATNQSVDAQSSTRQADRVRRSTQTLCSGQLIEGGRHKRGVGKTQRISVRIGWGVEASVQTMCATKNRYVDAQSSTIGPIDLAVPHQCSTKVNS